MTILRHAKARHGKVYASKHTAIQISFREDVAIYRMAERFSVGP